MKLNPIKDYIRLDADGAATALPGGDAFWSLGEAQLAQAGRDWLISEYEFTADWPTWEMHPGGDEFVYLLEGAVELLLEKDAGVERIALRGTGAVIVPRGVWHTARVTLPSRMLHVTRGGGTQTRPVGPA